MRQSVNPARILLIDDDELSRELLLLLLTAEGYVVEAVSSGEQAIESLRTRPQQQLSVLADLQMPGIHGADLATALRVAATRQLSPLLAMSGSRPSTIPPPGYDAFLLKPFTMLQLASALGHSPQTEPTDAPSTARPAVLDEIMLTRLRASMQPHQLDELFRFALADAERQLEIMRRASAEADQALYCRSAHSLKGSFGMLGASELHSLATSAESEDFHDVAAQVTTITLFLDALRRLRHTLVTRGVCPP